MFEAERLHEQCPRVPQWRPPIVARLAARRGVSIFCVCPSRKFKAIEKKDSFGVNTMVTRRCRNATAFTSYRGDIVKMNGLGIRVACLWACASVSIFGLGPAR